MKIHSGITEHLLDVTNICLEKLTNNNIIEIPYGDQNRANFFTDPIVGIHKKIFIENNQEISEYDEFTIIKIDIINNTIDVKTHNIDNIDDNIDNMDDIDNIDDNIINNRLKIINNKLKIKYGSLDINMHLMLKNVRSNQDFFELDDNDINNKLTTIHNKLNIKYGSFDKEIPEQKMVIRYLTGNEKVLEIGGNIGRNSLVISSILGNNNNFVVLESDVNIAKQLTENMHLNNFNFHIENSALSNRKLIQKVWDTIPSDTLIEGYNWIKTITLLDLKTKYNIEFDTLVLDCEGAFYYILMDFPEILDNIKLIIMENDYWDIDKKNYIDDILIKNNFYRDYVECGGWGPCYNNFFEVWKR